MGLFKTSLVAGGGAEFSRHRVRHEREHQDGRVRLCSAPSKAARQRQGGHIVVPHQLEQQGCRRQPPAFLPESGEQRRPGEGRDGPTDRRRGGGMDRDAPSVSGGARTAAMLPGRPATACSSRPLESTGLGGRVALSRISRRKGTGPMGALRSLAA
ncbi:hypothetical protein T484DRAFT_1910392 [Baffinella frigidus]|nr:hypothetical protein T484DRAFT_1910392 [Cryptophyta sp. CCMP2293]